MNKELEARIECEEFFGALDMHLEREHCISGLEKDLILWYSMRIAEEARNMDKMDSLPFFVSKPATSRSVNLLDVVK